MVAVGPILLVLGLLMAGIGWHFLTYRPANCTPWKLAV